MILRPAAAGIKSAESYRAKASIINLLGIEVAHLFSGKLKVGEHSFTWDAASAPAGVYEVRLVTPQGSVLRRVVRE